MPKFDFYNSSAYRKWNFGKNFAATFIIFSIICAALLVVSLLLLFQSSTLLIGLGQIILGLVLLLESYLLALKFSTPKLSKDNLADRLSTNAIELLDAIIRAAVIEGITEVDPEYMFDKFTLTNKGKIIFLRLGLPYTETEASKNKVLNPVVSQSIINLIANLAQKQSVVEPEDLLENIVRFSEPIQNYLREIKLTADDVVMVINWERNFVNGEKAKFWEKSHIPAGIGEDWAFGYTPILANYSSDLSKYFEDTNYSTKMYSHANIISTMETILSKPSKNNCLLVGDPGVGKKTIVNALAQKLAQGNCPERLKYLKIRQIDTARLIGGGNKNEIVERLDNALGEAITAGNIILYIDNFQSLLGSSRSGSEEVGGIDASQVLLPYLENSGLRIIASISPDDYFSRVRANAGIAGVFEKIDVAPADIKDTLAIMLDEVGFTEYRYNVYIPFETLKTITTLSDRYIHDVPFPEKGVSFMEEIGVALGGHGKLEFISSQDVEEFISKKANVPIGEANEGEKEKLLNLENLLHSRVVGQEEAISAVADALRRVRAGLTSGKRPAGVFLFLGPTGVGKTETAKALAQTYFGSEKNMIRLDMSEYQQPSSIQRLIGSESNPSGILTDAILANPFSLVLLDEIEKADKNVLNIFLQVFEDGRLTDVRGKVSDFTNSIIIATSNAGSEFIRENAGKMPSEQLKESLVNMLQQQGIYTPEFINRFDSVIVYKPLTRAELMKVANYMLADINKTLAEKRIAIAVSPEALAKLAELGYDPQFGARPMRRVIQEKVENLLAKKMLEGSVREGGTLNVGLEDIE